jgi:hypothetical protein
MAFDQEEDFRPAAVKELFNSNTDLTLKTETPPKMVLPLVRLRVLRAAADQNRRVSLLEVFISEFDRRMVSISRKGRLELLAAMQAASTMDQEPEGSL